jgi:hypothetical protein
MPSTVVLNQVPVELFDADGNAVQIVTSGSALLLGVRDEEQHSLLCHILKELKRMNKYMQYMMEENITDEDLED